MVNWTGYLESICNAYAQWWNVYTLTDVEGQQREELESPPLFNFMVETVQPAKEEHSQKQQKTERLDVLEGLRKYAKEHVLLVGRPGSGKSTALARLLLEEAEKVRKEQQAKIPVLVELRYYKTSVLDLIRSFFKQHGLLLDNAEIERLLFEQQFRLLVDGLNELPSEAARQDLIVLRRENAATPMIFTTRDLGVGGDLGIAKKLEMQHLTEPQMRDFVKRYLPEQGEHMLRQLGERLREFGQTPLLLLMLCSLFAETGDVPPNLGLVFRKFTNTYIYSSDDKFKGKVRVTDESRRWWRRLLEHLALRMTQGREPTELQVAISKQEAEEILTAFLRNEGFDKPRDRALCWLQDLLNHHLIQLGAGEQIEFRHQLIQEYYTAESLLKQLPQLSDDSLKREYLNYLKWTEPLALMLELLEQEAQTERVVRLALEVDLRLGARLAGAVKPEFQAQTVALVAGIELPEKVKIELLSITLSDKAIPALLQALKDQDYYVRSRAACALGNIGNEAAIKALLQALNHEDYYVRNSAAYALRDIGNEATVSALLEASNHEDSLRIRTAEVLVNIGNEATVPVLLEALNHEDSYVRSKAAEVLGNIGNEAAVPALLEALNHEDSYVRSRAAYALVNIGNEATVPVLLEALNHEDSYVRSRAAEVLGNIGNEAAVPALLEALNHKDYYVRSRAAYALGNIRNEAAIPALLEALNHGDSYVRRSAAEVLVNIGNEATVPTLLQALNHEDYYVRSRAAEVLKNIRNEATVPALLQALNHEDYYVRSSAAYALGNIGNEAAVTALLEALNHEDYYVRSSAAYALGNIGNEATVPALLQALNDKDYYVRRRAVDALGNIGNEAAVTALLQALRDEDYYVRRRAADALEKTATFKLLLNLTELLRTTTESYLLNIIAAIQERCKFYNYTLAQPLLVEPKPDISPVQPISIPLMYILHLSDLHFGTPDNAHNWYSQLAEDLYQELNCPRLDTLILSGDIANKSTPEEYAAAKLFLDELCKELHLQPEQIVIVPGNHDLNWGLAKKAYRLERREDYQSELREGCFIDRGDIIEVRDEMQYQQRFAHFSNFYQAIKGEPYPLEYEQQGILHHFPEQNLLILALNSAWQLDHHYKSRASINANALSTALTNIRQNQQAYQDSLKIAVWHHPLNSAFEDRITDRGFMEQLAKAGFRFAFHGHIHTAETSLYSYDLSAGGRRLNIICAGTFGAPVREWVPGYPLQYNLLKLEDNKLTVQTRRREELNGAWKPDARWTQGAGKDPLPRYEIQL